MRFTFTKIGPAVVWHLAGSFGADADLRGLQAAVRAVSDTSVRALFLDLAQVGLLDCTGIGEILRLRSFADMSDRIFGLVNVCARQRRLLDVAGLTPLLGMYDSVAGALSSLPPAAPWPFRDGRSAPLLFCSVPA